MPSGTKSAGTELGAFQSASPPTTQAGLSISSTAAPSPRGSRHDSDVGVAPSFHTAKVVSKKLLPLGRPIATKSPGFTPLAAKARARALAPRSSCSQVSVSAPWRIAIASFGLRSAYQRGTSAIGISMPSSRRQAFFPSRFLQRTRKRVSTVHALFVNREVVTEVERGVHIAATMNGEPELYGSTSVSQ